MGINEVCTAFTKYLRKVRHMTNTAKKLVNQANLTSLTKLFQTGKD